MNKNNDIKKSDAENDLLELSSDDSCDDEDLTFEKVALRRMVVIDTLNVLHQCAQYNKYAKTGNYRCEAMGVLLLCWKLLKLDFDLKLFIPDSYMTAANQDKVANHFILEKLQGLGYLTTIRIHAHDDLLMLEYAKCTGGFIISNDKYRDHAQTYSQIKTQDEACLDVIKNRVVRIKFNQYPPEWLKGGKNTLASDKAIGYLGMDFVLHINDKNVMYATPDDPTYGLVFAQRMARKQRHALNALDELTVMCEYFRQELCQIHSVSPPKLPYFDPSKNLDEFGSFYRKWELWNKKEQEKAEEAKWQREWMQKNKVNPKGGF